MATALVSVVAAVAFVVSRRQRPDAPSQPRRWPMPAQTARADFEGAPAPWLGVLITSATCASCERIEQMVRPLASPTTAVTVVAWQDDKELHEWRRTIEDVSATDPILGKDLVVAEDGSIPAEQLVRLGLRPGAHLRVVEAVAGQPGELEGSVPDLPDLDWEDFERGSELAQADLSGA